MAAKGNSICKAQRSLQGFAAILKSAACEWLLIFLMLIDALLSYVLTKFAYICNLQTPCILCSRLDHLLGKEKPNNYRNLLCTNHRLEISSLVSCYKHNKLVDGNEMCDACLCSFPTTNHKPKSNSKMQRLMVGKLRSDSGGNGAHGKLQNRDSIPHCIGTRPCSCCNKPWKTRPNVQGLLQLKSSVNTAIKPNIPWPRRLNSRDSLKKMRDKISGSVTLQHAGKTGFNLLSHVGHSELKITSDSESEVLLSEEDDDRSLICEKSELKKDSILQSITQIPLKPHCNNCDQVKPSINFVDSRPSPLESYVQVDVPKPHYVKSLASDATTFRGLSKLNWLPRPANPTANLSALAEFISLDDASSPASNALGLLRANSMEKNKLTDSLSQESAFSCSPEFIILHHNPQVVGKLTTFEETGIDNMGIASLNELEDHSILINTTVEECPKTDEVVNESAFGNTNDDMDRSCVSESSESDKEQEVFNFATGQPSKKEIDLVPNDMKQSPLISTTVGECPKTDEVAHEYAIRNSNDDMDHSSVSESSESGVSESSESGVSESTESDKEQEVFNFATGQPSEKETDLVTNNLNQSPLISTTDGECPKTNEVTYEPAIRNSNDDIDHSSVNESSESDKEQEVFNFATGQPSEKETDLVTNNLNRECPKTDELAYEFAVRNSNDDMDHSSVSESSESNKEQEVFNFATRQPSEKEADLVTNNLNQSPLISTTVGECPKTDEVAYESAIRNNNDDMDHSSVRESSESDKEQGVFKFATGQPSQKETDLVTNNLNQFPLISTTIEECPKTDEVVYKSAIMNTNDDINHTSVSESFESNKEQEVLNFANGQPSEKETDLVTNNLKQSLLISEERPKTDEVVYESAIRNTNDDMDHSSISESFESDKEQKVFNLTIGKPSDKETDIVNNNLKQSLLISTTIEECPKTNEVIYEFAIRNTNDDMDHSSVSESSQSNKEQRVINFAIGQPLETKPDIVTNDMKQFPLQNNLVELINRSSSDDEGHNFSISCDVLQEEFASEFNIIRALDQSVSMESDVESLDGSNVSEIEGEDIVDRLKRQVEYDKKCINSLYKELEEERSASEVAASQAMAMITRLQEEKAAMHMEALHYLRMMEEQAEYDVEALEKANELLNEKEKEIEDLEVELDYYRTYYPNNTRVEIEHEESHSENGETDIVEYHECDGNYSFKSTTVEASKGSIRSLNHQTSSLEFEDEKVYIQLCLKSLEDKINKISTNGLLPRVPNCMDIEEVVNPEEKGEESIDAERSQRNKEENDPSMHIDRNTCNGTPEEEWVDPDNNGRFGSEENFPDMKGQMSCANKREEVDFLSLEHKISDLAGRLEALQADYDFLEHSLNSLRYGEEGLQFAQNIVHQLQELCKLGIRLDRQPGS